MTSEIVKNFNQFIKIRKGLILDKFSNLLVVSKSKYEEE